MEIHSVQDYINVIEKLQQNYTYSIPLGPRPVFGSHTIN